MASTATLSRSAFASKHGSRYIDDFGSGQGHSRRGSTTHASPERPPEDKIAVPIYNMDSDSMKYPIADADRSNTRLATPQVGGDFGKSLLDGAVLSGHGRKSNDGISDKIPAVGGPIEWKTDVFELDVSSRKSVIQPGLIPVANGEEEFPPRNIQSYARSRRQSNERLRTPDDGLGPRQVRKGSVPQIDDSPGKEVVVRPKRLSGLSMKSVKGAFSRGHDAPEVVPQQSSPRSIRNVPPSSRGPPAGPSRQPRPPYDTRRPSDSVVRPNMQHLTGSQQLRSMQSSPALNNRSQPMSPAVPKPWMSRRPSASSMNSTFSDVNKPLPEPPRASGAASPPSISTTPRMPPTPSRRPGHWQDSVPSSPAPGQHIMRDGRSRTAPSNYPSKAVIPRSRFAHLDALDDAFQRSENASFDQMRPPATAVEMTFRDLDTIRESPSSSQYIDINAPLQIARGPMIMEPTRPAPPTPKSRGLSPNRAYSRNPSAPPSVPSTPRRPSIVQQRIDTSVQNANNNNNSTKTRTNSTSNTTKNINNTTNNNSNGAGNQQISRTSEGPESPTIHRGGGKTKLKQLLGEESESHHERGRLMYPQANLNREVFEEPQPIVEASQPMTRKDSLTSPYRTGSSDAQFDEIRKRLELLTPTTTSDASFVSSQVVGQLLSNQTSIESPMARQPNLTDRSAAVGHHAPTTPARPKSMSPVELPAEVTWTSAQAEAYEMDASEPSALAVEVKPATPFPPPPIPESPGSSMKRTDSKHQSMLSSGSGRTKSLRSVKSARSARSAKARSLNSVAISEIQELYAGLPSPRTTLASRRASLTAEDSIPELPPMPEVMTTEELEEQDQISAAAAEQVLYQIMRSLHDPEDLFNASLITRGFQLTFRRHDTKLLRHALWYSSGPAWEYLEMHMPISGESGQLEYPPSIYREQYIKAMRRMANLKSLILRNCGNILSGPTTILLCANNTKESAAVDDAIWRIWTFCKIFGEDVNRREDLEMQKQWIKGQTMMEAQVQVGHSGKYSIDKYPAFGFGNDDGLTPEELIRMGEVWLCLRRLVRGYQGQRSMAREYGIFEDVDIHRNLATREEDLLDEWTIHLLSLAPGTNPDVLAPNKATADNFIKAEELGYTNWTPPKRNTHGSGFLTGPICSVLEEWLVNERNVNLHPALRPSPLNITSEKSKNPPSLQTVEGFVSHIRTSQDGREFRRLLNGPRPGISTADSSGCQTSGTVKIGKEGKKSGFSKFSIRLPSRSQTTSKPRSKALAPPKIQQPGTAGASSQEEGPSSPTSPVNNSGSRFDLIRNLTQRTRKNSAVKEENRPTNLFANATMTQNGRLSPGTEVVNSNISSQATLSNESDPIDTSGLGALMPIKLAAERLLEQGYEPEKVDRVILESSRDGRVNYEKALKKMKKTRLLQERLKRLDRMG